jgi:primosomal protein N' (replication factor Y)
MPTARATDKAAPVTAPERPVGRVCVDVSLAHLDRPFDYLISAAQHADAVVGVRVRVRFAGRLVDGFLLERVDVAGHAGQLAFLQRVVSPEPVLSPDLATLARSVADRYAGTMPDVLRLAVPPRHGRGERRAPHFAGGFEAPAPDCSGWGHYPRGAAFTDALHRGASPHAVWQAVPGEDWPGRLAEAAATTLAAGRGAVLVVPDHRDVARLETAVARLVDPRLVAVLTAEAGPERRYRRWLAVRRGVARLVIGTRAAMFAPVAEPGFYAVWDDGDDSHAEPHAPYPHVRDVLVHRAHEDSAGLLVGGFARTAEGALLVESGWAHGIVGARGAVRRAAPRIRALGADDFEDSRDPAARSARLPTLAHEVAREAVSAGAPVLVQVPRGGYVPSLACESCRERARCRSCGGPLALPDAEQEASPSPARCRWCGSAEGRFRCRACGGRRLRAAAIGARRTAEELARAFPTVPVRTSASGEMRDHVPDAAAVVVATPGAEPVAAHGYGAALLCDGTALLGRAELRAAEEALRRWMAAASLVRAAAEGGRVVVLADSAMPTVQALVRWDPAWHADRELAGRRELGFPPAVRMAALDGAGEPLAAVLRELRLPPSAEVLGPVPTGDAAERALIRVERARGRELAASLAAAQAARVARKQPEPVRVRMDPLDPI